MFEDFFASTEWNVVERFLLVGGIACKQDVAFDVLGFLLGGLVALLVDGLNRGEIGCQFRIHFVIGK